VQVDHSHEAALRPTGEVERSPAQDGGPCDVTLVAHDVGGVGGMERQLAELVLGLRALGHGVTVISRTCELPADAGVTVHRVRAPRRPFLLGYAYFMIVGSLVLARRRRGVVQVAGAIVLNRVDCIAVHCCHQVYRPPAMSERRLARRYAALLSLVKRVVERACFAINSSATFVCVSNGVADEISEHYPNTRGRVLTIHNGVDVEAFSRGAREREALELRAQLGISEQRRVAAFVGGGWEHKGLRLVIEALAEAGGWDLVVAGYGNPERYRDLVHTLGLDGAVHWLGIVQDIQVVYELADAFVLPSNYETFSLVTFEAAANGLPILATAVNGVRELIEDGESGYLITRRSSAIAERLRELAADPALASRLGQAAHRAALGFSWERMVAEHHELYQRLCADRDAGAVAVPGFD
jgi:glycosyltransferase involved in cell wall biosynthesis